MLLLPSCSAVQCFMLSYTARMNIASISCCRSSVRDPSTHFPTKYHLPTFINWPATMWGPAIAMVRVVRLSVGLCHTRISPKLSEIDQRLLQETRIENRASRFRICHQIRDRKYGSAILYVPCRHFVCCDRNAWGTRCSEWRNGHRHLSVCHLAQILYDHIYEGRRRKDV